MIAVKWTGKAVSVNKWHMVRAGRIYASNEYKQFIESLAWAIKGESGCRVYRKISLIIHVTLNNRMDHHNLIKPVCDAIEQSGIIMNDKNIEDIRLRPAERHRQGEKDEIILMISEIK